MLAGLPVEQEGGTGMSAEPENVDAWFDTLVDDGLAKNDKSVATWDKYKSDLQETKGILSWLPNKLRHDVMVPIGPKALMRGKMVHTNELLVNLGETWFVKRTASQTMEICERRIKACDEMLDKLKKERELLEKKKSVPAENEAFGSEERPEIVEYVTEEEHEEWTRQHRVREKEYRQKLKEMRDKEREPVQTEEDLWKRLDELELREELEDELLRLNADNSDEDEDASESVDKCDEVIEDVNPVDDGESKNEINLNKKISSGRRRVSFSMDLNDSVDDEPLRVEIKHSPIEPVSTPFDGQINSPADIYNSFKKALTPQSILKNSVNVNKEIELSNLHKESESDEEEFTSHVSQGLVINDVVAKNMQISCGQAQTLDRVDPPRRISKFKASRMKKS